MDKTLRLYDLAPSPNNMKVRIALNYKGLPWRSGEADAEACRGASALMNELTADLEERLQRHPWLMGSQMNAADVTAAPAVFYGMVPPQVAESSEAARFFSENLTLGEGRERTRAWVARVMAHDS